MTQSDNQPTSNQLYWVEDNLLATDFPPLNKALRDPDGLLAIGGDLSTERLLDAYKKGIFPWFNEGQPVMWWSPDPRCVLLPEEIKISRSLAKRLRQNKFNITYDTVFIDVLNACAAARKHIEDTWITNDIKLAYTKLFESGYAHSVECWQDKKLIGGLYGLAMGKVFFGESMFSFESDASKVALVYLAQLLKQKDFRLIDCQVHSPHLQTLGAKPIQRELFVQILNNFCNDDKILFQSSES
ncbi:MAG: leucyl/phenylalanyl-tRNA--protein transferase [Proteobacteria bacterium]|nr:leucyl/phenylalanyl-tRNA--protein transferase [Pseudomonadota bacterium]NOG59454.1 leucyl/phenylalanyl-tRNA--protein transferase [Pseudomonadota bacterium]